MSEPVAAAGRQSPAPPARRRGWWRGDLLLAVSLGSWLAQMGLTALLLQRQNFKPPFWLYVPVYLQVMFMFLGGAAACRLVVLLVRRQLGERWREVLSWRLGLDLVWIALSRAVEGDTYTWTKTMVPALHHASFDELFARLDRWLFFGHDPNVFVVALLRSGPPFLALGVDRLYSWFVKTTLALGAWYCTAPRRGARVGFALGFGLLWLTGLWGYVLFPALGPAFVAEDLWRQVRDIMPSSVATQALLAQNYAAVLKVLAGQYVPVHPLYGVAAMPSLHVGVPVYFCGWALVHGSRLRMPLLLASLGMFVGSLASGWHYAVDGLAGSALAVGAVWVARQAELWVDAAEGEASPSAAADSPGSSQRASQ